MKGRLQLVLVQCATKVFRQFDKAVSQIGFSDTTGAMIRVLRPKCVPVYHVANRIQ
jgi:hypothetical protein